MVDLNLAVSIDPKDADLYHNRALIHRRNVRTPTALTAIVDGIECDEQTRLCGSLQNRYAEAKNDYVRLYTLRQVPLKDAVMGSPDHHNDLYSPTHVGARQDRTNTMYGDCAPVS